LGWKIELSREAEKSLAKLGAEAARRIAKGLREVAALDSPRQRGKAMTGNHAGHGRYRFGDYRVIARLDNGRFVVLVIAVGHRRDVYR
jgi:mRNA interferase RelE/StbE